MQVAEVHQVDQGFHIGGGTGFVTHQVREAQVDARAALDALGDADNDIPVIGPHPREAAIAAAGEAVIHLTEGLQVEAPEDAIVGTRHAIEELVGTIAMLERMGQGMPVRPGDPPAGRFERALGLLVGVEHRLMGHVDRGRNRGIVPPWLR